jgi:PKD repeat protein
MSRTFCSLYFILGFTFSIYAATPSILVIADTIPFEGFNSDAQSQHCAPSVIQFQAQNALAWQWYFPGGVPSSSTLQNPVIQYPISGFYGVSLSVKRTAIRTDTFNDFIHVQLHSLPTPNFDINLSNHKVAFLPSANLVDGPTNTFAWSFGDGTNSTTQMPEHNYASSGTYSTSLTITNQCGVSTSTSPVVIPANFTSTNSIACVGSVIQYTANSATGPYLWSFIGGTPASSNLRNPIVTYNNAGIFDVSLTVAGTLISTANYVTTSAPPPTPSFTAQSTTLNSVFTASNTTGVLSYEWRFNDLGFSDLPSPSHRFPKAGTYPVCLTTANLCGTSTFCQDVVVGDVSPKLAAKIFLQGATDTLTGLMSDGLRINNKIPLNQPYNTLVFGGSTAYTGTESINPALLDTLGNNAIVDWVLMELRSETDRTLVIQRRAALLQRDGDIVDIDGKSPVDFPNLADGKYHVAIRHRLCLATRTQAPLSFAATTNAATVSTPLDMRYAANNSIVGSLKLLGANTSGVKQYGLYIGDTNRDGFIFASDVANIRLLNPTLTPNFNYLLSGYDLDFNGLIFASDVSICRLNNPTFQVDLGQ